MSQLAKTIILAIKVLSLITISFSSTTTINHRKEKLTHIRLFWHDTAGGPNPTVIIIVHPPANFSSPNKVFGTLHMLDDPLTSGPDPNSTLLGRAQGFYGVASQHEIAVIMGMNFYFISGKYNGSSITILGRTPALDKVREMPVIGGTGLFRFARGYARATTHAFDVANVAFHIEYNLYVLHYN